MKKINRITLLTGLIATASAITPAIALTSCSKPRTPSQSEQVLWQDGWYGYETLGEGQPRSNIVDINFSLKNALNAGESLEVFFSEPKEASTANRKIVIDSTSISGNQVTVRAYLQSTQEGLMYIGDHVDYDATFTCKKGGNTLWTYTIEDLYFYMFCGFKFISLYHLTAEPYIAFAEYKTTVNYHSKDFGTKILSTSEITNVYDRDGVPSNVNPVKYLEPYSGGERSITQRFNFSDSTGLVKGASVKFDLKLSVWLAQFPDSKLVIESKGLKLIWNRD